MLIEGFYRIKKFSLNDSVIEARIALNPEHKVYEGHFPGQPVVPGVIQLQIVKEMLEKGLEKKLLLSKVISAKYYSMIIPGDVPESDITIQFKRTETGEYKITAQIQREDAVFTKVRAIISIKKG